MSPGDDWRPTATLDVLKVRASLLARARRFFEKRSVLEVDTPIVVNAPVTDVHIHSTRVQFMQDALAATSSGSGQRAQPHEHPYFLHTSPEYAMKRLLAAGSGDIYQICHVVRGLERGRQHNAEFALIEWYRVGFSLDELMSEVDELVRELLGASSQAAGRDGATYGRERLSYREAFERELNLDPFDAPLPELAAAARAVGFEPPSTARTTGVDVPSGEVSAGLRDELLELLMGAVVGPKLGHNALTFVYGYPATQAALARLDPKHPRAALRFELYCNGMELANGFHELVSAGEQRKRFERDIDERRRLGLPAHAIDERLLAGLAAGLPDCAGVALGFDRTVMLAVGAGHIDEVLAFPTERA